MSDRLSFFDILTFPVRVFRWRPIHVLVYLAAVTVIYYIYYAWSASPAGLAFYTRYAEATALAAAGQSGAYLGLLGINMLVTLLASAIMTAGGYRIMVRDPVRPFRPLGIGADEIRILGGMLSMIGLFFVLAIGLSIALSIVVAVLGVVFAALGAASAQEAGMALAGLMAVVLIIAISYVLGRFAVCLPQSIADRRFGFSGWAASKGFGRALFGAHFIIVLATSVVQLALAPDLLQNTMTESAGGAVDIAAMAQAMSRPYGVLTFLVAPLQAVGVFYLLGPTAAVVSWRMQQAQPGAGRPL